MPWRKRARKPSNEGSGQEAAITGLERNEFLLCGDAIGVSQLIETLNHGEPGQPVGCAPVGPFWRANAPFRARGAPTFSADSAGERVRIAGRVFDFGTKAPLKGVVRVGEDARGYIYDRNTGIMAVQISRKARAEVKDTPGLKHDYLDCSGRYKIDPGKQVVRRFVEGELFPGSHPAVLEGMHRFGGGLMSLRPVAKLNQEILWQRGR